VRAGLLHPPKVQHSRQALGLAARLQALGSCSQPRRSSSVLSWATTEATSNQQAALQLLPQLVPACLPNSDCCKAAPASALKPGKAHHPPPPVSHTLPVYTLHPMRETQPPPMTPGRPNHSLTHVGPAESSSHPGPALAMLPAHSLAPQPCTRMSRTSACEREACTHSSTRERGLRLPLGRQCKERHTWAETSTAARRAGATEQHPAVASKSGGAAASKSAGNR
jgi:hypothetical protein